MSRSNLVWLLLALVAGIFLAFNLFQSANLRGTAVKQPPVADIVTTPTQPTIPASTPESDQLVSADHCYTDQLITGGTLVESIIGAPRYPNPLLTSNNPVDQMLVDLIFDGLVSFDATGLPQPALAKSWVVSEDGRIITFSLRSDVLWHDGESFDSADVAFTYSLLQAEGSDAPDNALWQRVTIRTPDAFTVEFELDSAYSAFLVAVSRGILPSHILDGFTYAVLKESIFNQQPVGTGLFSVENNWQTDGFLRLKPQATQWEQAIGIEQIELRFFANEVIRATAFANEQIDALIDVDSAEINTILALKGARLFSAPQPRYSQLIFNLSADTAAASHDVQVRTSLALATDKQALITTALNGQAIPFNGPFVPTSWAASPTFPLFTTDIISASAQLTETGWLYAQAEPVRISVTDGVTETLTLHLLTLGSAEASDVATLITQQWAAVGAEVIWQAETAETYYQRLNAHEFDVALITVNPLPDPDLYDFWSQAALISGQNFGAWNDQRASEALEAARQLWSVEERGPLYGAFNREFAKDLPAISLYQYVQSYVLSERVLSAETNRPVSIPPIARPRDRFITFPDWRIQSEQVAVACEQ